MNLTKPAQAMELRRLSQCSADLRGDGRESVRVEVEVETAS
jgi:hypothetical protein